MKCEFNFIELYDWLNYKQISLLESLDTRNYQLWEISAKSYFDDGLRDQQIVDKLFGSDENDN